MSEWIDISRTLENGIICWPGDLGFECRRAAEIDKPGRFQLSELHTSTHVGTHIDAPSHFFPGGQDITAVSLETLCGPASVVDIRARRDVSADDLEQADIPFGDRVLLRTANESLWEKPAFDEGFFAIAPEAAQWLVDHEVPLVGVDYMSVDAFGSFGAQGSEVHRLLLGAGVAIAESLDLSQVSPGRYELVALPLKIAACEASPARIIIRPLD